MSIKVPVIDLKGKEKGSQDVLETLFGIEPNEIAVQSVCKGQLFRFYKKTATTKGRSAVSGGGKKIRKQKGSGRARQGGNRGPQFVGGGVVFGPTGIKRDYKVNRKLKKLALASALSDRQNGGQIRILGEEVTAQKTQPLCAMLKALSLNNARVAFVVSEKDDLNLIRSIRNMPRVDVLTEEKWTPLDVVKTDSVIFSKAGLDKLTRSFSREGAKK
ncbi:50S ribosomal protein L4 [bacterium]|nr:50S ribosomal protein L4 [bacterium]